MKMIEVRSLSINPVRCTGCRDCQIACSMRHAGYKKCTESRIHVMGNGDGSRLFFLPVTCQQCVNPPCAAACPKSAIRRDPHLDRVVLDEALCVGCKMCVSACPTGAMGFDPDLGLAYKCDLCDGDPQCVRVCQAKAIEYVEGHELHQARMMESASKIFQVIRSQVA
jgi:carbon-monoxide dehydrogenase iron sulfur subunit